MNVEQVENIMSRYNVFGEPNTRLTTSGERRLVYRDVAVYKHADYNDAAFNADSGIIRFKNNKVVRVEFLPD